MKQSVVISRPRRAPRASSHRAAPRLPRRDQVDLWRVELDATRPDGVARLRGLLSGEEEERAAGFYFERDRRRFVVGRGALRQILAAYLGAAPAELEFAYGANGKPRLGGSHDGAPIAFNLSHSDELGLVAVTRPGDVGVDLERLREMPDWQAVAASFFSRAEQERLAGVPEPDRPVEFFRAWTRQEARLKATGRGLAGFDERSSDRLERQAARAAAPAPDVPIRTFSFTPAPGYVAALAVGPAVRAIAGFSWTETLPISPRRLRLRSLQPLTRLAPDSLNFL